MTGTTSGTDGPAVREGLAPEEMPVAVDAASRAFMDDPGGAYIFPNPDRRRRALPPSVAPSIRFGQSYGVVVRPVDHVEGVAVWVPPPGRPAITFSRMLRCGGLSILVRCNLLEVVRAGSLTARVATLDPESFRKPHWYLWMLAVAPERQGQGVGSALLRPVLERADAEGMPCALETMTERNVRFYRKHGFTVSGDSGEGGRSPRVWAMWREPGSAAGAG